MTVMGASVISIDAGLTGTHEHGDWENGDWERGTLWFFV